MRLQLITTTLSQNRRIAPRLRIIQHHRFLKQLEPINLLDSVRSRLNIVKDDEGLALGLEVGFGDYLDDGAIFSEELFQGFFEVFDFDAFLEIADLYAMLILLFYWVSLSWHRARVRRGTSSGIGMESSHRLCGEESCLAHLSFPGFERQDR